MKTVFLYLKKIYTDLFRSIFAWVKGWRKNFRITHGLIIALFLAQMVLGSQIGQKPVGAYQVFEEGQGARKGAYTPEVTLEAEKQEVTLFTQNLLKTGFDWKPHLAVTEEGLAYPASFHSASFYFDMESDLRQKWLLSRASKYHKSKFSLNHFLQGEFISTVELSGEPQVRQLSEHQWESEVRAVRVVVETADGKPKAAFKEKLSFLFVVEKVPPRKGIPWGMEGQPLNQVLNSIPSHGLKIIDYKELA